MNSWSPDKYAHAWHFATKAHQGQTYGGAEEGSHIEYINHIGSVAMEIICALQQSTVSYNGDLAIQCALLHDVLEDTSHTFDDLANTFGIDVADGVMALTKDKKLTSKQEQMLDSLERIKHQPKEIWMVKLADRITNLYHPPFYWNNEKIMAYRTEAMLIHTHLKPGNEHLAQRLEGKIEAYQAFFSEGT